MVELYFWLGVVVAILVAPGLIRDHMIRPMRRERGPPRRSWPPEEYQGFEVTLPISWQEVRRLRQQAEKEAREAIEVAAMEKELRETFGIPFKIIKRKQREKGKVIPLKKRKKNPFLKMP